MGSGPETSSGSPERAELSFRLERFAWPAPDRLEIEGTFLGVPDGVLDSPSLVIRDGDRVHHLPMIARDRPLPPLHGERWSAAFRWQGPPVAFASAELHLRPDLLFDLPWADSAARTGRVLTAQASPASRTLWSGIDRGGDEPAPPVDGELGRTRDELQAARAELEQLRLRHEGEVERLRDGLAAIRACAEDALALERGVADALRARLHEAEAELIAGKEEMQRLQDGADADALLRPVGGERQPYPDGL